LLSNRCMVPPILNSWPIERIPFLGPNFVAALHEAGFGEWANLARCITITTERVIGSGAVRREVILVGVDRVRG
jgi:hypothetical protein